MGDSFMCLVDGTECLLFSGRGEAATGENQKKCAISAHF